MSQPVAAASSADSGLGLISTSLGRAADAEIEAWFESAEVRESAIARVLDHLDGSPPAAHGGLSLVVETTRGDETYSLDFTEVGVRLARSAGVLAQVRIGLVDAVRLATGQADGALLYLGGRLSVSGDEDFVLALGTNLRVPSTGRALIDPAALDPVAVSEAIADVATEHLAAVMAGGFRDLILSEVFARLPDFLIAEKAERVRVTIGFEIERDGHEPDLYVVRVADGVCTVLPDPASAHVDATLVLAGHEFLRLVLGRLNPVRGVMAGQLRVRGHLAKALGFNAVMHIPGSR